MRLGVVGMLPADFRTINRQHLETIRALGLSGAAFHAPGDELDKVKPRECDHVRSVFVEADMTLPQFGIGYGECLFDPDKAIRDTVVDKIAHGIVVARDLGAHTCLIRTGSRSETGSYSPHRENHSEESRQCLIETLGRIAFRAEAIGVTMVVETHVLTIMGSPEINRAVLQAVGSERMRVVMDYVNHFQTLEQVYHSTERLNHIYDIMGSLAPVGHCKDIRLSDGLVLHIDEEVPGDGELDIATALSRWHVTRPEGYMLLEHLPVEKYPRAAANTLNICKAAGIEIH